MNIASLNKDELISHTAELVSNQDQTIHTLKAERQLLWISVAVLAAFQLLF